MAILKILLVIGLINVALVNCSRILVLFYHHGPSHFNSFLPLFDELAERGHNVTVLTYTHVEDAHKNYNEILLEGLPSMNGLVTYQDMWPLDRSILTMHLEFGHELYGIAEMERENALKSPQIDRILEAHREQPFDLVLYEQFITDFYLGLVYKLNVPFIGFSSCALPPYFYDVINQPDLPSFIPFVFGEFDWNMSLYQRIVNWFSVKAHKMLYRLFQIRDNQELRKRFGDGIPDVAEIAKNISLTLVNQHYSYSGPKPLSRQLIEVGGIHIRPPKPLPQNFKQILDNAKNGVLLVSWGGNVKSSTMPEHIQHEMIKGFAKLSLQVIWKWENASIQNVVSKNVHVASWLPQRDILCHPNVKVFWTHGGNLGTIETVHCGKPSIVTPFYGDQYLNAAALSARGMGFRFNLLEITADGIYNMVQEALDPKVVAAAQKVSYEHNNRQTSPLETAVWWVEHAIATRGFELGKTQTFNMSWFEYYSLDSITLLLMPVLFVLFVLKWLIMQLFKCCCTKSTQQINSGKKRN